ncbi:MAG: quinoprotein amine dehydrogenase, beta chain-like protein, partial [Acidithiobacillus caldus]|nr:quinoprotein amine dehydrogenase, beta chain-like protein [Acidithiobacillus caldus]
MTPTFAHPRRIQLTITIACALGIFASSASAADNLAVDHAVQVQNQDYVHVLPSGRKVSPVGTINSTANFPTMVAPFDGGIAVLANGATPSQSVEIYGSNLQRKAVLAIYRDAAPKKAVVLPLPSGTGIAEAPSAPLAGGVAYRTQGKPAQVAAAAEATLRSEASKQALNATIIGHGDLFQGLTSSKDGVLYATGGASDQVLAM